MAGVVDENAVAFFTVVDGPGYLPMAITALRSVRRFHPDATYLVVGRFGDDAAAMQMIDRHGLDFHQLDLSAVFTDTLPVRPRAIARPFRRISWPSECYWWFYAPTLMEAAGHRFSCALDGDVLAVAQLDLDDVFDDGAPMAAVAKRNGRVNSGVLFLDNSRLREFDLYAKALDVYHGTKTCAHGQCTGFCRVGSDQTLLHEVERVHGLDVRRVSNRYNHLLNWDETVYVEQNADAPFGVDESRILHLLSKPWLPPRRPGRLNPVACDGYRRWWSFAREIWPDDAERARFFGAEYDVEPTRSLTRMLRR